MSHSAVQLTGNSVVASVLSSGAVYRSVTEAGAENGYITGVTGEGLNCGSGDNKQKGNFKEECFWISGYKPFVIN